MAPWELEERPDGWYWAKEAMVMSSAENQAQEIAADIAKKRRGTS